MISHDLVELAPCGASNPADRADGTGRFAPGPPLIGISLDASRGGPTVSPEKRADDRKRIPEPDSTKELLRFWLVHAHKGRERHDVAARRLERYRYWLGVPATALSALVGTSVFASLGDDVRIDNSMRILVGLIAILAAVLASVQATYNFGSRADSHRSAGVKYKNVIRQLEERLSQGEVPLDPDWLANLRAHLEDLEASAPVVPEHIYDRIERRYGPGVDFVGKANDLYGSRAS